MPFLPSLQDSIAEDEAGKFPTCNSIYMETALAIAGEAL